MDYSDFNLAKVMDSLLIKWEHNWNVKEIAIVNPLYVTLMISCTLIFAGWLSFRRVFLAKLE